MKKCILLLLLSLLLFLPQAIKRDFRIPPIYPQISSPDWEVPPPNDEVRAALNQPFTYLARGNQSTVFASVDGRYVLKLFRSTRPRFPFIQSIKEGCAKAVGKRPKDRLFTKLNKTMTAAHIAYTEAKAFTQLVYCHLNLRDDQLPSIQLGNYVVPLDRYRFVLQKRVQPFKEALLGARKDPEQMHRLIHSFVALIHNRSALGIRNSDPNLAPNFGFLNGEAVEIDFGNYYRGSSTNEKARYVHRLRRFLKKKAPERAGYVDDR